MTDTYRRCIGYKEYEYAPLIFQGSKAREIIRGALKIRGWTGMISGLWMGIFEN